MGYLFIFFEAFEFEDGKLSLDHLSHGCKIWVKIPCKSMAKNEINRCALLMKVYLMPLLFQLLKSIPSP
jgi:hypothetical protein